MKIRHEVTLLEWSPQQPARLAQLLDDVVNAGGRVVSIVEMTQRNAGSLLVVSQRVVEEG